MLQFLTSRKLLFVAVTILLLTWIMFLTKNNRDWESSAESFLRAVVNPVEHIFDQMTDSARGVIRTVGELHHLSAQNRVLAEENDRMALENQILHGYALENARLRAALSLREKNAYDLVAAEVIARSSSNWFKRMTIDRGSEDGIKRDMGVIAAGGVVGRIYAVRRNDADVLLLTDAASQIGGMVERTGAHVLVRGESTRPGYCQLVPLRDAEFRRGDQVVTWEQSEYFPRGLAIGVVESAARVQGGIPMEGRLKPAVNPGRLDVVFVIKWMKAAAE